MAFKIRHIIRETPQADDFLAWQELSGLDKKKFVNTNGKKYKELGLKDKIDAMSDKEVFTLIAKDGMLVKRPILAGADFVLVGFKQAEWEALVLKPHG